MHLKVQLHNRKQFIDDSDNFVLRDNLTFALDDYFLWFYDWDRDQFVHWFVVLF